MNRPEQSRCRVKRSGIVCSVDPDEARIVIEGKTLSVPIGKCAPSLRTGDRVGWDGTRWIGMPEEIEESGGSAIET